MGGRQAKCVCVDTGHFATALLKHLCLCAFKDFTDFGALYSASKNFSPDSATVAADEVLSLKTLTKLFSSGLF